MDFYRPVKFKAYEFVDRNTYNKFGEDSLKVIDIRMLITMDRIRNYFGKPIIINNWKSGGNREWSGLRIYGTPYFSTYSQHSFGRAIDFIINGIDAQEVRNVIKKSSMITTFEYITSIEDFVGMNWIHIDCRNWDKTNKGLLIFSKQG